MCIHIYVRTYTYFLYTFVIRSYSYACINISRVHKNYVKAFTITAAKLDVLCMLCMAMYVCIYMLQLHIYV